MSNFRKMSFDDVLQDVSAGNEKTPQSEFAVTGLYPIIDQGQKAIAGYTDDADRVCRASLPVILFGDHTRCFKYVDFPFCIGADGVKVLRPRCEADVKYLYHALRALDLPSAGYDRHFKHLRRTSLNIPSLPEQRRIAAILDKADHLRAKRLAALAALDGLAQSVFVAMFGEPLSNPRGWERRPLAAVATVTTGSTPPSVKPMMFGGDIPFVTPADLDSDTEPSRTVTEAGAAESRVVRAGATLVCCIGSIGKIGRAARKSAFNQQINAVEWGPEIDDDYGLTALRHYKSLMERLAPSSLLPILKKSSFQKLEIPIPPLSLQRGFAAVVARIEANKASHRQSARSFDELVGSLRFRAFRGEL